MGKTDMWGSDEEPHTKKPEYEPEKSNSVISIVFILGVVIIFGLIWYFKF